MHVVKIRRANISYAKKGTRKFPGLRYNYTAIHFRIETTAFCGEHSWILSDLAVSCNENVKFGGMHQSSAIIIQIVLTVTDLHIADSQVRAP